MDPEYEDVNPDAFEGPELEYGEPVSEESVAAEAAETAEPSTVEPAVDEPADVPAVEETPAQGQPAVKPVASPKPAVTPEQTPQPQVQPEQRPTAEPVPLMHDMIRQNHDVLAGQLAKSTFALSKEDSELFEDPRVADFVARSQAGVFLKTMAAVSQLLHNTLPTVVRNVHGVVSKSNDYERTFYEKHPDLHNPTYQPVLRNLLVAIRSNNPGATPEQLMDKLAPVARVALGIVPGKQPVRNGGTKPKTVPFVPAAQGAGAAAGTPRQPGKVIASDVSPLQDVNNMLRNLSDSD